MPTRSPFPGMDPWLERHWDAVHHGYVQSARDQIADQLPDGLFSEVEETVYVIHAGEPVGRVRPDVGLSDEDRTGSAGTTWNDADLPDVRGNAAVATPVRVTLDDDPITVTHVVIRSLAAGEPLVTAVEVLSPTNKLDPRARRRYLRKRRAYIDAGANVVEIDLLRAGRPIVNVPWDRLPADLRTPYRASVRRATAAGVPDPEAEYYPIHLRGRLPVIRLPLRPGDPDVALDLQLPIDHAYDRGRYARRIDYARPAAPPLSDDDAAWAAERIAASQPTRS